MVVSSQIHFHVVHVCFCQTSDTGKCAWKLMQKFSEARGRYRNTVYEIKWLVQHFLRAFGRKQALVQLIERKAWGVTVTVTW